MKYPLDELNDTIPMALEMPRQVLPSLLGAMRLLLENAAWESNDDKERFANAIADAERRLSMPSPLEIDASQVVSGVLDPARVPPVEVGSLDASQVVSGVLSAARVPSLDASKITSGVLSAARVPSLDASKITSGVLDPARVPPVAREIAIVSSVGMLNQTPRPLTWTIDLDPLGGWDQGDNIFYSRQYGGLWKVCLSITFQQTNAVSFVLVGISRSSYGETKYYRIPFALNGTNLNATIFWSNFFQINYWDSFDLQIGLSGSATGTASSIFLLMERCI